MDIIGNFGNLARVEWKEINRGDYNMIPQAISYSNILGNTASDVNYKKEYYFSDGSMLIIAFIILNKSY